MTNPYKAPASKTIDPVEGIKRVSHSVVALISGILLFPAALIGALRLLFPLDATQFGNVGFWSSITLGSLIAAIGVFPFKRMPLWLAGILGPMGALGVLLIWVVWLFITGRGLTIHSGRTRIRAAPKCTPSAIFALSRRPATGRLNSGVRAQ